MLCVLGRSWGRQGLTECLLRVGHLPTSEQQHHEHGQLEEGG